MDMNAVEPKYDRLPLPYVAALAGFVAAACPMVVFLAVGITSGSPGSWRPAAFLLVLACAAAVPVMVVTGVPLHNLIRALGLTKRWPYVVGTSVIISGCYLFLLLSLPGSAFYVFAPLIPIAAVPSGLLFHHLAQRARYVPSVDRRDVFIVATWIAAGIFLIAWFVYPHSVSSFDPERKRYDVANLAFNSGLPAFMLCGFAAGFARLWSLRLGTFVAGLAWLIPVLFVVAIYVTPRGPEKIHFTVGDRVFDIDWHMSPRPAASGFCFDASGRGPYADSRRGPINREICISQTGDPLVARVPSVAGERRWIEAGLNCEEVFVTPRAGRVCSSVDASGHTATLIECQPGDCFLQFDDHGLRYSMHLNPEDFAAWRTLQERALRLVTEVSRADSSPGEP